jgi:hypothetical protein
MDYEWVFNTRRFEMFDLIRTSLFTSIIVLG